MCRAWRLFLLTMMMGAAMPAHAAFPFESDTPTVAPVLKQVTPGVVSISVRARQQIDNPLLRDPLFRRFFNVPNGPLVRETQAIGSGVIVDAAAGTVLTNNHVVANADLIEVTLADHRKFKAKLIGRDPTTDIAVLRIPAEDLTAVPYGDSDKSQVGDFVLAIGNPFGLGQTVTSGIISATGRSGLGIEGAEDFLQTDASINPGNSGGALVDLRGRLVGINTAILAPSGGNVGLGFAVPVNMARSVMTQLLKSGHVERGWIGVSGQDITPDLSQALQTQRLSGAVISGVGTGSPADEAGLRPGDIIAEVDGAPIGSWSQFSNKLALSRVGQTLALKIERLGKTNTVTIQIAPQPAQNRFQQQMRGEDQ